MSRTLFIDDIIHPRTGSAISMKPIIDSYINRYNMYLAQDTKMCCIKDNGSYIIHVQTPSEKNAEFTKNVHYDTIIEFYPIDKLNETDLTLKNYGVKVFSNAPSWMFSFTYVFAKNDCIPKFIPKSYYSKAALTEPPKKKNPIGLFGIDRIVFSAFYHLELNTGYRKNRVELITLDSRIKPKDLIRKVMSQEEKLEQINYETRKASERKKTERKKAKLPNNLDIIKRKDKELGNLRSSLDHDFGEKLETSMNELSIQKDFKENMVAKVGLQSNLRHSMATNNLMKKAKGRS